jgi:hypothetical protein
MLYPNSIILTTQNNKLHYTYWDGASDIIMFTEQERTNYLTFLDNIINQPKNVNLPGKTYTGKLSNVPRHKLKEYFETTNGKKTSRVEQCDNIIVNKSYITELYKQIKKLSLESYFKIDQTTENYQLLKEITPDSDKTGYNNRKDSLLPKDRMKFTNEDHLFIHNDFYLNNPISFTLKEFISKQTSLEFYKCKETWGGSLIDTYSLLEYVFKNPNVKIAFDDDILETLNSDGIELDKDYLKTLDSMFNSLDQDNINMALEMLSNVNIEKDSLKIALLLNKHVDKFNWGSGKSINNHRSFKSIIKYYNTKNINFKEDWVKFSLSLYKVHQNNEESKEIITDYVKDKINIMLSIDPNSLILSEISLALKS